MKEVLGTQYSPGRTSSTWCMTRTDRHQIKEMDRSRNIEERHTTVRLAKRSNFSYRNQEVYLSYADVRRKMRGSMDK